MADFKNVLGEIRKGKNLDINLPVCIGRLASDYGEFAAYNLAMSLSMIIDKTVVSDTELNRHNQEIYDALFAEIKKLTGAGFDPEENRASVEKVIGLRELLKHRMEAITALVDELVIHEYVINRLEPKFEPGEILDRDNDEMAKEILRWIFKDEDNALVNERIKTSFSCLPIRLTKGKMLDYVDNTFNLYRGADKLAVENFDYMLRSATGLYKVDEKYSIYENINELLEEIRKIDLATVDARQYYDMKDDFRLASGLVSDMADELTDLTELANNLLTVILNRQYFTLEGEKAFEKPLEIISEMISDNADFDSLFTGIENRVERLNEDINENESILYVIRENYKKQVEELMLTVPFGRLLMSQRLMGESTFATLLEPETSVDDDYLEDTRAKFLADLGDNFKANNRLKNRAIMAQLFRELPVVLSTKKDVMDYVRQSLDSCSDAGEKQIAINLIRQNYD